MRRLMVPLVRPLDWPCDQTDVEVTISEVAQVQVFDQDWSPLEATPAAPTAEMERPRLLVRQYRDLDGIGLGIVMASSPLATPMFVDRALIETTVAENGEWATHARYLVSGAPLKTLRIRPPEGGRITQLRWREASLTPTTSVTSDTGEVTIELAGGSLGILEVRSQSVAAVELRSWMSGTWDYPELVGDISWGQVLWQLTMPERMALLRGPTGYGMESRWVLVAGIPRLVPRYEPSELERWLSGSTGPTAPLGRSQRYLFGRLVSMAPISITAMSRPLLVVIVSGSVLLLGVVLFAVRFRGKIGLALFSLAAAMALGVLEPTAAVTFCGSAGPGLVLMAVAGPIHLWIARHRSRRRTVFPEPGALAQRQGAARRPIVLSSSEAGLGHQSSPIR